MTFISHVSPTHPTLLLTTGTMSLILHLSVASAHAFMFQILFQMPLLLPIDIALCTLDLGESILTREAKHVVLEERKWLSAQLEMKSNAASDLVQCHD